MWMNECQNAFETLKDAVMKNLFQFIKIQKPYTLFTDALKYAWSAVLRQEHTTLICDKIQYINVLSPMLVVYISIAN